MKKVYLVHGWGGSSQGGWFDWLKKELAGIAEVIAFDMPDTDNPKIEAWVGFLEKNIKSVDRDTYFVGHSIGCQAVMRFLEKLPEGSAIGGAVFVAGWFNLKDLGEGEDEIARQWLETPINFMRVRKLGRFLAIFSDNDPYVPVSDSDLFKKNLGARVVIKKNKEHFNAVSEIPEVLEFLSA
jgi:predicted alpha/beta hydrolase family esterase